MNPSTFPLDIIPSGLLKEELDTAGPSILPVINSSLVNGYVPAYFKHAVIYPLIKKPNIDPSIPNNYWPVSKLSFLSKNAP